MIADRIENIMQGLQRHREVMAGLEFKRSQLELDRQRLTREADSARLRNQVSLLNINRGQLAYQQALDAQREREKFGNAEFSLPIPKTRSIPQAVYMADRVQDANSALSAALGYDVHYDSQTGRIMRNDTGQSLSNREVMPHMNIVSGITILNSSPRRFYEDMADSNDPRAPQYRAALANYKTNPMKFLSQELAKKQDIYRRLIPYIKDDEALMKMAEMGINATIADMKAVSEAAGKAEERKWKKEFEEFKAGLKPKAEEKVLTKKNKIDLWNTLTTQYNKTFNANLVPGQTNPNAPDMEQWKQEEYKRATGEYYGSYRKPLKRTYRIPSNIKTTSEAVNYLVNQGLTKEEAVNWLRMNR